MNDLTSMVVKKIKAPAPGSSGAAEKCKAEVEEVETAPDKKTRLEESAPP